MTLLSKPTGLSRGKWHRVEGFGKIIAHSICLKALVLMKLGRDGCRQREVMCARTGPARADWQSLQNPFLP
jgi:hypothetical protein